MNALEILLGRRWILKSRDRELYYRMKDEAPAIKKCRQSRRTGWGFWNLTTR